MGTKKNRFNPSRREFLNDSGLAFLATATGLGSLFPALAQEKKHYNILLILTDQEQYMPPESWPAGFELPGHQKLASRGIVFDNHQIASCVCTPSRSVIYTGQHVP